LVSEDWTTPESQRSPWVRPSGAGDDDAGRPTERRHGGGLAVPRRSGGAFVEAEGVGEVFAAEADGRGRGGGGDVAAGVCGAGQDGQDEDGERDEAKHAMHENS